MTANKETKVKAEGKTLHLSRQFDAPRQLVFEAYSDCKHLRHWWAPEGWSLVECDLDFQVGGRWHYCMRADDGSMESWGLAEYKEIQQPDRLQYRDYFSDAQGEKNAEMPSSLAMVTLSEADGVTTLVVDTEYASEEDLNQVLEMGIVEGVGATWDKLDHYLADQQD